MERQWLHDSIIEDYLCHEEQAEDCVPAEPWILYTCGVKGAGKRHLINTLMESGKLISLDIAELNPTFDRDSQTAVLAAGIAHRILHYPGLF